MGSQPPYFFDCFTRQWKCRYPNTLNMDMLALLHFNAVLSENLGKLRIPGIDHRTRSISDLGEPPFSEGSNRSCSVAYFIFYVYPNLSHRLMTALGNEKRVIPKPMLATWLHRNNSFDFSTKNMFPLRRRGVVDENCDKFYSPVLVSFQ